jgi:hypothetical protein
VVPSKAGDLALILEVVSTSDIGAQQFKSDIADKRVAIDVASSPESLRQKAGGFLNSSLVVTVLGGLLVLVIAGAPGWLWRRRQGKTERLRS